MRKAIIGAALAVLAVTGLSGCGDPDGGGGGGGLYIAVSQTGS